MSEQDVNSTMQDEVMAESDPLVEEAIDPALDEGAKTPDTDRKGERDAGAHGSKRQTQRPSVMHQFGVFVLIGTIVGAVVAIPQACSDARRASREAAMSQKSQNKSYGRVTSGSDDSGYSAANMLGEAKPIIYLYPEDETEVSIHLADPELITVSYPDYGDDGWCVTAQPDGTLSDTKSRRSLYSLYYEATLDEKDTEGMSEGFVVVKGDLAEFLETSLSRIGLTEREVEEFIVYWLPQMEEHEFCYVRFALTDEEQSRHAIRISPEPNHLIRVRMIWKGLDEPIDGVANQDLPDVERDDLDGFIAVEWGGTRLP